MKILHSEKLNGFSIESMSLNKEEDYHKVVKFSKEVHPSLTYEYQKILDNDILFIPFNSDSKFKTLLELEIKNNYKYFLDLTLALAKKVKVLHDKNIIHGNLTLNTFFVDLEFNILLFDFAHASICDNHLSTLTPIIFNDIPFYNKTPEQVGRINKSIDFRTDLYNLGLIFFQLLKDKNPFYSPDSLEQLHLLLTKNILSLEDVPSNISSCIVRLLQKDSHLRYQSIEGLIYDLELMQDDLETIYELGTKDISNKLQMVNKVYGRDNEIDRMVYLYKRVCSGEKKSLAIGGYSGIGKSALINELRNNITDTHPYFVISKFDQYKQNLPFYGIQEAFNSLVKQILSQDEDVLKEIKKRLLKNLKGNGKILIDIITSLEEIIGKQPEVEVLPANENENRFSQVFLTFLKVIATKEKPLILVIDDLQWMDIATLKLLSHFIQSEELSYVFIILAYRDNEIEDYLILKNILQQNDYVESMILPSLSKDSLHQFLKDTFCLTSEMVEPLCEEIYIKTDANPFFFKQFIQRLYYESLISFNRKKLHWEYDIKGIKEENISDNVAEFMLKEVSFLKDEVLKPLQIASCLGATFDLKLLQKIDSRPLKTIVSLMKKVFDMGFLVSLDINIHDPLALDKASVIGIKFLHDQVQQAVYSTILNENLKPLHYEIGQTLLREQENFDNCFEIVSHLNIAHSLLSSNEELFLLAQLNLEAGKIAKSSTAYDAALVYIDMAKLIIEQLNKKDHHQLYIELSLNNIELLYLTGNFQKADEEVQILFKLIDSEDNEIRLRRLLTVQYTRIGRLQNAIDEGLISLSLLGMTIESQPKIEDIQNEIGQVQKALIQMPFSKLVLTPEVKDERILKILDILMEMQPCSYNSGSLIFPITILRLLGLTIEYGNSSLSYYIYTMYALMNSKVLKDYEMAFEASKYATKIQSSYGKSILTGRVNMMRANFIMPWNNKLKESSSIRQQAYLECLDFGDYYWGIHAYIFGFYANFLTFNNLDDLYQKTQHIAKASQKISQLSQYYVCQLQLNLISCLRGELDAFVPLTQHTEFETKVLLEYEEQGYMCGKYDFIVGRLIKGFLFGSYKEALLISLDKSLDETSLDEGIFHEAFYKVFNVLSILSLDETTISVLEKNRYDEYLDETLGLIETWKKYAGDTFEPIYLLIQALLSKRKGPIDETLQYYEQAIESADKFKLLFFQGIINESYAKFWEERQNKKVSNVYYQESINFFKEFKAHGKVKQLESKLLRVSSSVCENRSLDLNILMQSSNILSKEVKLEQLVYNILEMVFKLSGAQNGLMFFNKERPSLVAQIQTDQFNYYLNKSNQLETLPESIISYVCRTQEMVLINDFENHTNNFNDTYLEKYQPQSILVIPLILHNDVKAVIYLENYSAKNIFLEKDIDMIQLLSTQMVISIENAHFYEDLENLVAQRTNDLQDTLSLFDTGPNLLFKWENKNHWPVSYVSENVHKILGYKKEDILLSKVEYFQLVHEDDIHMVRQEANDAIINKKDEIEHQPYRIRTKLGEYLWVYDLTKIIYNEDDEILYFIGYIIDITVEKHREEYLSKQHKMVALGEMIGNIAHQWRQPLSLISTSISSLKLKKELNILEEGEIEEVSSIILNTTKKLSTTIDNFSNISTDEGAFTQSVNINKLVYQMLSILQEDLNLNEITVEVNIDKVLEFNGYKTLLFQVMYDLVQNSMDALKSTNLERKVILIKAFKNGDTLEINLKDNGGGIPIDVIDRVFEPYYTTKHKSQGKGLGLYSVHKIINNELNGRIEIDNNSFALDTLSYQGLEVRILLKQESNIFI